MMHEQKFKDLLYKISSERRVSDLESEVLGSILFRILKPIMAILALLPMLCVCEKLDSKHGRIILIAKCGFPFSHAIIVHSSFFHNRLIRRIEQEQITNKFRDLTQQSGTLTITLEFFLRLCEAIVES